MFCCVLNWLVQTIMLFVWYILVQTSNNTFNLMTWKSFWRCNMWTEGQTWLYNYSLILFISLKDMKFYMTTYIYCGSFRRFKQCHLSPPMHNLSFFVVYRLHSVILSNLPWNDNVVFHVVMRCVRVNRCEHLEEYAVFTFGAERCRQYIPLKRRFLTFSWKQQYAPEHLTSTPSPPWKPQISFTVRISLQLFSNLSHCYSVRRAPVSACRSQ
jgi:hypothetical protein